MNGAREQRVKKRQDHDDVKIASMTTVKVYSNKLLEYTSSAECRAHSSLDDQLPVGRNRGVTTFFSGITLGDSGYN